MTVTWTAVGGCFLAFSSAILYAFQGLSFKMITTLFFMETMFIQNMAVTLASILVVVYRKEAIFPNREDVKWLTIVAVLAAVGAPCRFYAVVLIPFADAFALCLSGIMVFSLVLGRILLKETCGVFEAVICVLILVGMALISDPKDMISELASDINGDVLKKTEDTAADMSRRILGFAFILAEIVTAALMGLAARKITNVHFSIVLIHVEMWCLPVSLLMTATMSKFTLPSNQSEWINLVVFCVAGVLFNFSLFQAYALTEAGTVSTIRTFEIAVSYLLQFLILGVKPSVMVISGAVVVSLASFTFGFVVCKRNGNAADGFRIGLLSE